MGMLLPGQTEVEEKEKEDVVNNNSGVAVSSVAGAFLGPPESPHTLGSAPAPSQQLPAIQSPPTGEQLRLDRHVLFASTVPLAGSRSGAVKRQVGTPGRDGMAMSSTCSLQVNSIESFQASIIDWSTTSRASRRSG